MTDSKNEPDSADKKPVEVKARSGRAQPVNKARSGTAVQTDESTVFKGKASAKRVEGSQPPGSSKSGPQTPLSQAKKNSLTPDNQVELTRIGKTMREQSSQGFKVARTAANKALAENKIILNKRFVLESTLGAGGMGTVYQARDLRKIEANDLNPFVAIKVLNEEFKNHPDAFVTLQREASRSHTLSHPNIVTVHDFDRDGDVFFMTMELLEGVGLETFMRKYRGKGMPVEEALPIIRDYCQALIYAHQKHIIHSDLKPGNLFVSKNSTKVLDFGIARITSQAANKKDFDAGSLGALTPNYASLEMIRYEEPHPSDDVFAAAIIAYELFAGVHPYNKKPADEALAEGLKPVRIKSLSKQQWRALDSALKLERSQRTQSMADFYRGLTLKQKVPIFKISSAIFLVVIAWFLYLQFFGPDEVSELANSTFNKAQECFNDHNYQCSVDSAKALLKIDPKHAQGYALLQQAEQAYLQQKTEFLMAEIRKCLTDQNDEQCARDQLNALKQIAPESPQLIEAEQWLVDFQVETRFQDYIQVAEDCLEAENYGCTVENSKLALKIRENNQHAEYLFVKAQTQLNEQKIEQQQAQSQYLSLLSKARDCFSNNDYDCTLKYAEQAADRPVKDNSESSMLLQNARFAAQQAEQNLRKAKNIWQKGVACYEKKNYSCAIANSESALEFVPGYRPALQLKSQAQKEIENLKKQIIIN